MFGIRKILVMLSIAFIAFVSCGFAGDENVPGEGRKGRGGKEHPMRKIMEQLHKEKKEEFKKLKEEQKAFFQSLKDMDADAAKAAIKKRSEEVYNKRVKSAQETYDYVKTEIAKLNLPDEKKQMLSQRADERYRKRLEHIKASNKNHTDFWLSVVDMKPEQRKEAIKNFREATRKKREEARQNRKENREKQRKDGKKRRRGNAEEGNDTEDVE